MLEYPKEEKQKKKQRALYAKVKCHNCGYSMKRTSGIHASYYCETPKFKHSPDCVIQHISEESIEITVLQMMKTQIQLAREKEREKELIKKRLKSQKIDFRQKIKQLQISVSNLHNIKFKNYELYKDGKMNKEDFTKKKAELDIQIENAENQIAEYGIVLENENQQQEDKG